MIQRPECRFPLARRDFYAAEEIVSRLLDRGMSPERVESIGHMMISIAHIERRAEFKPPTQTGEKQKKKAHANQG